MRLHLLMADCICSPLSLCNKEIRLTFQKNRHLNYKLSSFLQNRFSVFCSLSLQSCSNNKRQCHAYFEYLFHPRKEGVQTQLKYFRNDSNSSSRFYGPKSSTAHLKIPICLLREGSFNDSFVNSPSLIFNSPILIIFKLMQREIVFLRRILSSTPFLVLISFIVFPLESKYSFHSI